MLFMCIFTSDPEKRDAVLKRAVEKGLPAAGLKTVKIIGMWSAISGGRVFQVFETDDPKAMLATSMAWSDLGKVEIFPIMTSEDVMKLAVSKK